MTYVGIDLAWNVKRRTGVAALSPDGQLLDSSSVVTDIELDAWLDRFPDAQVIAIDAPLIVPNESGSRSCEKAIGVAFGRFDAGAYPANRGNPLFDPPRGATLSEHRTWTMDPRSEVRPLAIEVYPHPGMVGLFQLQRVIPYKSRPSRSMVSRREAFIDLCDRLERIASLQLPEHARWQQIRAHVLEASRPFHLDRVEDEVDAIFCAHLAWLWDHCPDTLQVYGDITAGYIVAPPPPHWSPAARVKSTGTPERSDPAPAAPGTNAERWSRSWFIEGRPAGYGNEHTAGTAQHAWRSAVMSRTKDDVASGDCHLALEVEFVLAPEQKAPGPEPDLDNMIKATIDALIGPLGVRPGEHARQAHDVRIERIKASKRFAAGGERPGASLRLTAL